MATKILTNDNSVISFVDRKSLQEYIEARAKSDTWVIRPISFFSAVGVNYSPITRPYDTKELKQVNFHNMQEVTLGDVDHTDEDVISCLDSHAIFLYVAFPDGRKLVPMSDRGYITALMRGGDDGSVMTRIDSREAVSALCPKRRGERLAEDFSLSRNNMKVLFRDGKIRFCGSKDYTILPLGELVGTLEASIFSEWEDAKFSHGFANHDYTALEYNLNDEIVNENLKHLLEINGTDVTQVTAGLLFSTSDVGLGAVKVTPFYKVDGATTALGTRIELRHYGDVTMEDFEENLKSMASLFKENEERLDTMGNIYLDDVVACAKAVAKAYPTFFSKKATENVLDGLAPDKGTAIDVYLLLNKIVEEDRPKMNPTKYLDTLDGVTSLMYLPWKDIDEGRWKK